MPRCALVAFPERLTALSTSVVLTVENSEKATDAPFDEGRDAQIEM